MRFRRLARIFLSLLAASAAGAASGAVKIELVSEAPFAQTATEKELSLVLPERFFRARGESAFSEPYIAELHYTTDGGETWNTAGLFKDLTKPFEFTADTEGRYGFFVTLVDQKGREDVVPAPGDEPQVTVLVDWTAPVVKLLSPEGGEIVGGGRALVVTWSAEDSFFPAEPITIKYRREGESRWRALAGPMENSGAYEWSVEGFDGRITVRVTAVDEAGHKASAVSAAPVLVDTTAPEARLVGPELAAAQEVDLEFIADDGDGAGVEQLRLWVSLDNGSSWTPAGSSPAGLPLKFTASDGDYGLYVTAVDRAGNDKGPPPPCTAPQLNLSIDTQRPQVRLQTLNAGGSIRGGSQMPLQWEAVAPDPAVRPISIFLSPDDGNTWELVAGDLENTGSYMWDVPRINSGRCRLKVTMRDSSGKIGEAVSKVAFAVDSTRPTSAIGVAPPEAAGPVGDLSAVLRPMAPPGPHEPEKPQSGAPAEPSKAPEPAEAPKPAEAPGDVAYVPEPTPAPEEPWTTQREEPFAGPPGPHATFEELLKAGFAAYRAGQLNLAKEYFRAAADMETGDPRPHAALGRIYAKSAGFNYTSKKQAFEAAIYEFEKALELGGEEADVLNDLGWIFIQSGRYEDAQETLRRAVEIGEKAMYYCNLGIALRRAGKDAEALKAFEDALEIDPEMKEAHFFLGTLYSERGEWETARGHWKKAVDGYGPDHRIGKAALAGLEKAREALGEVAPADDGPTLREKLDRIR